MWISLLYYICKEKVILWFLKSAYSVTHSRHVELDLFWSEFWFICVLFLLLFYLCVDLFICPLVLVDCLLLLFQCNIQVGTANLFMWTFLCLHYVKSYSFFIPPSLALYYTAPGCLNVCWASHLPVIMRQWTPLLCFCFVLVFLIKLPRSILGKFSRSVFLLFLV